MSMTTIKCQRQWQQRGSIVEALQSALVTSEQLAASGFSVTHVRIEPRSTFLVRGGPAQVNGTEITIDYDEVGEP